MKLALVAVLVLSAHVSAYAEGGFEKALACNEAIQGLSSYDAAYPGSHLIDEGKVLALPSDKTGQFYFYTGAMAYSATVREDARHAYKQPSDETGNVGGRFTYVQLHFPRESTVKTEVLTRAANSERPKQMIFVDTDSFHAGVQPVDITPKEDLTDKAKKIFETYITAKIGALASTYSDILKKAGKTETPEWTAGEVDQALEVCAQVPELYAAVDSERSKMRGLNMGRVILQTAPKTPEISQ